MSNQKRQLRSRRQHRIRAKIKGTAQRPRLSVFRSNTATYAQIIDDVTGKTLFAADDRQTKKVSQTDMSAKCAKAYEVGLNIGKQATEKNIKQIVFDRGGYRYHGRVKCLAEGARAAGLEF